MSTRSCHAALRQRRVVHFIAFVLSVAAARVAVAAAERDLASLAPADASLFVQIDHLADLRRDHPELAALVSQLAAGNAPATTQPFSTVADAIQIRDAQTFDLMLGKSAALIVAGPDWIADWVVLSRVDAADFAIARERFGLTPVEPRGGQTRFVTRDGRASVAFVDGVMLIVPSGAAAMLDVVAAVDPAHSLATSPTFETWVAKLPTDRTLTAFAHLGAGDGRVHVLSATHSADGNRLSLFYTGTSPWMNDVNRRVAPADPSAPPCPLPASTAAVLSLNLVDHELAIDGADDLVRMLDKLFSPRMFKADILAKLEAPMMLFVGSVPADESKDAADRRLPAAGVAVRMNDRTVAADLSRAIDGMVLMANVVAAAAGVDPVTSETLTRGKSTYTVVDAGKSVTQWTHQSDFAHIRVTYGPVGDWFILTTHDAWFQQCLEASAKSVAPCSATDNFIVNLTARPQACAALLQDLIASPRSAATQPAIGNWTSLSRPTAALLDAISSVEVTFAPGDAGTIVGRAELRWR